MKNLMKAFSSYFKHLRVRVFFRMVLKKVTWGFLLTVSVSLSLFLITTQFTQPVSLLSFTVTFILQTINRRMIFIDSAALFEPPSSDWSFAPPQIAVFLTNLRPSLLLTLVRIIVFSVFFLPSYSLSCFYVIFFLTDSYLLFTTSDISHCLLSACCCFPDATWIWTICLRFLSFFFYCNVVTFLFLFLQRGQNTDSGSICHEASFEGISGCVSFCKI